MEVNMTRLGFALSVGATVTACSAEPQNTGNAESQLEGNPAPEFFSSDGRRFVLRDANVTLAPKDAPVDVAPDPSTDEYRAKYDRPIEELSDEELAEALRPVTFIDGHEYILETPDYEAAQRVRAKLDAEGPSYNPNGDTSIPEGKAFCCGSDGRSKIRSNTSWPYRTVIAVAIPNSTLNPSWNSIAGGECTMQLIGSSTATSVAHCFHDSTNWRALAMWGAGPDDEDSTTFPSSYPAAYGCYYVYIPSAYVGSGQALQWDYAVIDFRNTCQPTPGNTVGWLGWGTYSDSAIEGATGYGYGVPKSVNWPQSFGSYPQIWGMSTSSSAITTPGTYEVRHNADCSTGDSGRGFRQYIASDWRSTANHSRGPSTDSKCRDRRLDSGFNAFIVANSQF